jgi:hypothetical protein
VGTTFFSRRFAVCTKAPDSTEGRLSKLNFSELNPSGRAVQPESSKLCGPTRKVVGPGNHDVAQGGGEHGGQSLTSLIRRSKTPQSWSGLERGGWWWSEDTGMLKMVSKYYMKLPMGCDKLSSLDYYVCCVG